ncbi:MAG: hypothetical protein K4571_15545 [Deltaproteobacteria bacterium]
MKLKEIFETAEHFKNIVEEKSPMLNFCITFIRYKKSFKDCFRTDDPSPEHRYSSGVYLFCDEQDKVIYIGKAASGNLAHRIWHHLKTPTDTPEFLNSPWVTENYKPSTREKIRKGKFTVSAIVVEPKELSSLLEVYLQTFHFMREDSKLPDLNNQIG